MSIFLDFKFTNQQDLDDYTAWVKAHPDASGEQIIAHARAHGAVDGEVEWDGIAAPEETMRLNEIEACEGAAAIGVESSGTASSTRLQTPPLSNEHVSINLPRRRRK